MKLQTNFPDKLFQKFYKSLLIISRLGKLGRLIEKTVILNFSTFENKKSITNIWFITNTCMACESILLYPTAPLASQCMYICSAFYYYYGNSITIKQVF